MVTEKKYLKTWWKIKTNYVERWEMIWKFINSCLNDYGSFAWALVLNVIPPFLLGASPSWLALYWQRLVHLTCSCVYYNTLLLHKIEKIKMAGSFRQMSSEMGDNHGNFNLFRLDSSVRIKTCKCAEVT